MTIEPLLLRIPQTIYTSRLSLRPIMPGDGEKIFEMIEESKSELKKWLFWVDEVKSFKDSERTACEFYSDFIMRKAMRYIIFHDNNPIGVCSIHSIRWDIPSGNIGYYCRTSKANNGFITEAINALSIFAFKFLQLKRLQLICHDENIGSAKVAEKLGYKLEITTYGLIKNMQDAENLAPSRLYARFNADNLDTKNIIFKEYYFY